MTGVKKIIGSIDVDVIIISSLHPFFTILADECQQITAIWRSPRPKLKLLLQDRFPGPLEQIIFYWFRV
jgi:hypothetical protein